MTIPPAGPHALVDLASDDPSTTAETYQRLLGHEVGTGADGRRVVNLGNVALSIQPAAGEPDTHDVYFTVDDITASRRLLGRRGYPLADTVLGALGETSPVGIAERNESGVAADGDHPLDPVAVAVLRRGGEVAPPVEDDHVPALGLAG